MPRSLLRTTLTVNALSSGVLGTAMAVTAGWLDDLLGLPAWLLVVVGVVLVPFAITVWTVRGRDPIRPAEVRSVIAADVAWVAASIVAVAVVEGLTTTGRWVVVVLAVVVADYAIGQWLGLRRLAGSTGGRSRDHVSAVHRP